MFMMHKNVSFSDLSGYSINNYYLIPRSTYTWALVCLYSCVRVPDAIHSHDFLTHHTNNHHWVIITTIQMRWQLQRISKWYFSKKEVRFISQFFLWLCFWTSILNGYLLSNELFFLFLFRWQIKDSFHSTFSAFH